MILAKFFRGPLDMQFIPLPTEEPWPRFVLPERSRIDIRYFYLYAGEQSRVFYYLFNDQLV